MNLYFGCKEVLYSAYSFELKLRVRQSFNSVIVEVRSVESQMTELVRGEASESDEETHIKIFASEVPGEATESDEDLFEKKSPILGTENMIKSRYKNNLLQRKLIDNNIAIYKGMSMFVKNFITNVSKHLLNTDQLLIKSQVTMQSVLCSLKNSQVGMKHLHEKHKDIFTSNFVPDINL